MTGWIGVDLDGTLAHYSGWKGVEHIGAPIPPMLHRVQTWLEQGKDVKIFTARASVPEEMRLEVVSHIHAWCERHNLPRLPVTHEKDFGMIELWDDRCVQVEMNTGRISGAVDHSLAPADIAQDVIRRVEGRHINALAETMSILVAFFATQMQDHGLDAEEASRIFLEEVSKRGLEYMREGLFARMPAS